MKTIHLTGRISILLLTSFLMSACSDYGYGGDYGENGESLSLDSKLYGTWEYDDDGDIFGWTFNSNGTCVQVAYGTAYDWKWGIEDSKLKLYVDNGIPAYYIYKVEGNLLYLRTESMSTWGLPFTKK